MPDPQGRPPVRKDRVTTPTETTQVKALLDPVGLTGAVVTADAAHPSRETTAYIASKRGSGIIPL